MSEDLPKAPAAVVLTGFGNFWVEESAKRVRELRSEAVAGLGDDDMVMLTGLESTGKTGDEGLISYSLALQHFQIGGVRSMSQKGFENMVGSLGEPSGAVEDPPGGRGPMEPIVISPDMHIGLECCCGHRLGSHDLSGGEGEHAGACLIDDCMCPLFHTHGD